MKGMTLIVKQVTRLVAGFILLYSAYLILYGHLSPGGGFAGGVTMACSFILIILAFGKDFVNTMISDRAATVWDCVGALGFLALAFLGYFAGKEFFLNILASGEGNFKLFSAGIIPLANRAIGIKVGAGLAGVFVALSIFRGGNEQNPGEIES